MDELNIALKKVLADTFLMYFKTHAFHWNVEGADFKQYHDFFGGIYEELFAAVDPIAEHVRALDSYAPTTLKQLTSMAMVNEVDDPMTNPAEMLRTLIVDNNLVIVSLMRTYQLAEQASELGLANFLQDRIDAHNKLGWMLKAASK